MIDHDCYFYVDDTLPESEQRMGVLCTECRKEFKPNVGWFYRGSVEGYGPFDFKCELCGDIIHKGNKNSDEEEETETAS